MRARIRRPHARARIAVALAIATALAALHAQAHSTGGPYAIERHTIDGGGGRSSGGAYVLDGTVGQPDAARESTGGTYALSGGFWIAAAPEGEKPDALFANGFE